MLFLTATENGHDVLKRPMPAGPLSAIVQLTILVAPLLIPEMA